MRRIGKAALCCAMHLSLEAAAGEAGWLRHGGDDGGTKHSPATQITPANVARLEPAWTVRTGDLGEGFASSAKLTFEATPILAEGLLYLSTAFNRVVALDPDTGREVWRADAGLDPKRRYSEVASRGVAYWTAPEEPPPEETCASRILMGTLDGRLLAFDARSGRPCEAFGANGAVDLTRDADLKEPGEYQITSPPAVFDDFVIVGSAIGDNRAVEVERGIVRAYDARTGALRWMWDPIPRDPEAAAALGWTRRAAARVGAANAWAPLSVDAGRGLVFVPTGSASPDFFGGERPGDNPHANSLVALDARTGKVVWAQQLVRHDLWDFDLPAQPVLTEIERDGSRIPIVAQTTKMGFVFIFERESGKPVFDLIERPAPESDVPGETAAKTQRVPVAPPPLVSSHDPFRPEDAWGFTFVDRLACRSKMEGLRSEGLFTPPSLRGTIMLPSYAGGSNWGGLAVDPTRGRMFANVNNVAAIVRLIPRAEAQRRRGEPNFTAQAGTPYAMSREILTSPLGAPCNPPPWGTLSAVDLKTGAIVWRVPLGTTQDMAPPPYLSIGTPNLGGPISTATGLVFIAAAADDFLRAFNAQTGEELWRGRLPAGGQATPMTYVSQKTGRQYVVIAAGGHGGMGTSRGDYVAAFALPVSP